jgi:hypothetical protein
MFPAVNTYARANIPGLMTAPAYFKWVPAFGVNPTLTTALAQTNPGGANSAPFYGFLVAVGANGDQQQTSQPLLLSAFLAAVGA